MKKTIAPEIRYIGVDDNDLDLFEGQYIIPEGISYNSYVILDEKIAIMDTVDARKGGEWLANLEEALGGRTPDYLVVQHVEPDHSGVIASAVEKYPSLQIVCSAKAATFIGQFFEGETFNIKTVAEGEILELGKHSLKFMMAPMVHWPEVMVSFDPESKVLFAADAFGKFGSLGEEIFIEGTEDWSCEARRYYFNICGKYGAPVQVLLRKATAAGPAIIAPLHGPILKGDLSPFLALYQTWSSYGVESEGVFLAYASIHGGTAEAAEKLAEILKAKGCPKVAMSDLTRDDMAEAIEDAFRYGRLIVAAASYDGGLFTPAHTFLHTLQMKGYCKRKVALVENGTWAPSAGRVMREMFSAMKEIELVAEPVTIRSRIRSADIPALEALADVILA